MSAVRALKRKQIEEQATHFELSENLSKFLPPTAEFSIGVQTEWFGEVPRNSLKQEEDLERKPRSSKPPKH